jgi:nitrogen fixation NifU-like protein
MYNETVLDHYKNPRNHRVMKDPDAKSTVQSNICGDVIEFYIKVKKVNGKDIIDDISFETFGCAASMAVGSMITELLKGKTLEEAEKLTESEVNAKLGGLPDVKHHCASLGLDALHEVIKNYKKNKK